MRAMEPYIYETGFPKQGDESVGGQMPNTVVVLKVGQLPGSRMFGLHKWLTPY